MTSKPGRPQRRAGAVELGAAGLDEHVPARAQPGRRVRDHPALHRQPVGSAVERDQVLVVARLARHQGDRLGRHVRRVGHHDVHLARQRPGQGGVEVALEHPVRRQVAPGARRPRPGRRRRRTPRRPGPRRGRRPRSRRCRSPGRPGPTPAPRARRPPATSSAVRCRGTKTPGATASRSPQNSTQPTSCSSGSPASRRATSSSSALSEPAASTSSAASSSAKTQPAARSRTTRRSRSVSRQSARSASSRPRRRRRTSASRST